MKLDHVSFAAQPDGLEATTERIADRLGIEPVKGGVHPRFGTRNMILPLTDHQYVEVVTVLEHPAAEKAPFGQAVRARSEAGGGWLGWVVEVPDLAPFEDKLGRPAAPGSRLFPDGRQLEWHQIGVKGLIADPQLPFMIHFDSADAMHPSQARLTDVRLTGMEIAGSPERVTDWLGGPVEDVLRSLDVTWSAPNGTPGLMAVSFDTPDGTVTI
ncbi:glycosyltransferase [Kocuria tytonicola]|uniref:VOC family protein n=1 Tax=Kocuria tytonicola TaxID=2055946 RepID=A0A3L9L0Z6_9MICC|nr:VOC family protein [Kocuria tytonicola]RLY92315.1 VOC family protein [Kocuria tytonicola]RLZ04429.1 glycosyltransferase [Kocuria tytonicola]